MSVPVGCREAVERLWEYLDGSLAAVDHQAIEAHLAFCRRCCGELEFSRELRRMLRARSEVTLPAEVQDRLEGVIERLGDSAGPAGSAGAEAGR